MDIFSAAKRSEIMSRVRGANTGPEKFVKKAIWAEGFRYARTSYGLYGKPDIVLPKYKALIFVHGCFWHGHACSRAKLPASNIKFWTQKIQSNVQRDRRVVKKLRKQGWHCFQVWQCRLVADTDRVLGRLVTLKVESGRKK